LIAPDPPDHNNQNTDENKNIAQLFNINGENIPAELKEIDYWIVWGYRNKDGGTIKVPIDPRTGAWVNAHDPENWMAFEEALDFARKLNLGVGFDFTEDLGYVFIDWDHVLKQGVIDDLRVEEIIEKGDTFTEISPSGKGLHQVFKSSNFSFDSTRLKDLPVEIYTNARYSTFTGVPYGKFKPIRKIEPDDLKLLLALKEKRELDKGGELRNGTLDDAQKKELTKLLEQNWDLDKPEAEGNHHQVAETVIVYLKEAGISKEEVRDFLVDFNRSHILKDGKTHSERDLINLTEYVYTHEYKKTAPAGSVSKEFKRQLYRILIKGKETSLEEKFQALDEILATGPNDAYETLMLDYAFTDPITNNEVTGIKTVEDPDSDKEEIYVYENGFYKRGESILKGKAESFYRSKMKEAEDTINEIGDEELSDRNKAILEKLKSKFLHKKHQGVLTSIVSEALNMVRRNTYMSRDTMNPSTHIPFKNGYINLETWELEPLNPSLFFTWQIHADYLDREVVPKEDMPLFIAFLSRLIPVEKVIAFLTYCAYAVIHPGFPAHKTLWLVGRQRIGKGTSVRLLHLINPHGHGTISIAKMLKDGLGFDISSIADKNFVSDAEVTNVAKQKKENWAFFNGIFGADDVDIEAKYKQKYTGRLRLKGIFIQNLPMIQIQNDATVERIIIIQTRDEPIKPEDRIPNIEERIFEKEGDAIVTYFLKILKILSYMNYVFPEKISLNDEGEIIQWTEMDLDEKYIILDNLSDEVEFFIEERTKHSNNDSQDPNSQNISSKDEREKGEVPVDKAYLMFKEWCEEKGIVPLNKQEFTRRFGREFPKKRKREDKKRTYVFAEVEFVDDQDKTEGKKKLGQGSDNRNPQKNRQLQTIECVSQLTDIKLIRSLPLIEGYNKDIDQKLGQTKNALRIRTRLNSQYKGVCPNLFGDVSPLPKQEPKQDPELDQKAKELFKSLKDKFEFFRPPEEHLVTREPSNVIRYLQVNDKLTEEEARSALKDWVEKGLVKVVQGQVSLGDKAPEVS